MFEHNIAYDAARRLSLHTDSSMEYLSVTNNCIVYSTDCVEDFQQAVPTSPRQPKHLLSLKPGIVLETGLHVKEELMARYAGDGYYFLEEYIDGIMDASGMEIR